MASVAVGTLVTDLTIGGRLRTGSGPKLGVVNPATERLVASIPTASLQDASDAVTAARDAFENGEWSRWSAAERGRAIARYADLLAENIDRISDVVTDEMGSPAS